MPFSRAAADSFSGLAEAQPMTAASAVCRRSASDSVTKTENRFRMAQTGLQRCIISPKMQSCRCFGNVSSMSPAM